ncbi:hypothetical protein C8R46DRAFT_1208727 [Mycena filopes]|nr:hypothetical protein C8R46DRAFT_1208727 [Mycena filopes]
MSILNSITDAASRAWNFAEQPSPKEFHSMLEWTWGLEYGSLATYLEPFNSDRQLADILADKTLIVVAKHQIVASVNLHLTRSPSYYKPRTHIQDVYDNASFEYLVLPVDPSSGILPRLLVSSVPPHVTVAPSVDHLLVYWRERLGFATGCQSIIQHVAANPVAGAAFIPTYETFRMMKSLHERWATRAVPSRFLGLEDSDEEGTEEGSSTMEWEVGTLASEDEEPQRRLLPHELAAPPVIKFKTYIRVEVDADDDAISCDSYVTGLEGKPEGSSKASMAGSDYDDEDAEWSKGIQSWAAGASVLTDDRMLLNDAQIEEDLKEQPRVATTLDLAKPDYLTRR